MKKEQSLAKVEPKGTLSLRETMDLGAILSRSGFFQDSKDESQAVVKVLAGRELGLPPIASMTGINVIRGRVTISANTMAAIIKGSGQYDYRIKKLDNTGCIIDFFERGEMVYSSGFSMEDAKAASLGGDNWKKYPRNMLFARALSNGARWVCPHILQGVYVPDELGAKVDAEGELVEVGEDPHWKSVTIQAPPADVIDHPIVEPGETVDEAEVRNRLRGKIFTSAKAVWPQLQGDELKNQIKNLCQVPSLADDKISLKDLEIVSDLVAMAKSFYHADDAEHFESIRDYWRDKIAREDWTTNQKKIAREIRDAALSMLEGAE